jgi:hypothetical protein
MQPADAGSPAHQRPARSAPPDVLHERVAAFCGDAGVTHLAIRDPEVAGLINFGVEVADRGHTPQSRLPVLWEVLEEWFATATDPLWGQQAFLAQQAQDPFAADPDAVLVAQAGADLTVALPSKWRGDQDLADQPQQVGVANRGRRARPDRAGDTSATRVDRRA